MLTALASTRKDVLVDLPVQQEGFANVVSGNHGCGSDPEHPFAYFHPLAIVP
jgi:hypothetical protein